MFISFFFLTSGIYFNFGLKISYPENTDECVPQFLRLAAFLQKASELMLSYAGYLWRCHVSSQAPSIGVLFSLWQYGAAGARTGLDVYSPLPLASLET